MGARGSLEEGLIGPRVMCTLYVGWLWPKYLEDGGDANRNRKIE